MASMTITIPDARVVDVLDALSFQWGYDSNTGETKAQFVRRYITEHLERSYLRGKKGLFDATFTPPADPGIDVT